MPLINSPDLWHSHFPSHRPDGHKYGRGVAVIYGAPKMTGATRLAAAACARIGAGLVKVIAAEGTGDIYRASLPAHIIVEDEADFAIDGKTTAVLFGPGWTQADGERSLSIMRAALTVSNVRAVILDAGAFLAGPAIGSDRLIRTPHDGEFARVFPDVEGDRTQKAQTAASMTGGIVVLKGAQTIIAHRENVILQDRPLPQLATAGTGDVLAGMIAGLAAQGMRADMACAAAVWIHAEAAARFGRGLVASDLPDLISLVLKDLHIII